MIQKLQKQKIDGIIEAIIDKNGSTQKILLEGYKQIEYLESTGTQWIKTGITNNIVDFKFVFDCMFFIRTPNNTIIGNGFEGTTATFLCGGSGQGLAHSFYGHNELYIINILILILKHIMR